LLAPGGWWLLGGFDSIVDFDGAGGRADDGGGVGGFDGAGGRADDGGGDGGGWADAGGFDSISVGFVWANAAVCIATALATTAASPRITGLVTGRLEEGMQRFKHSSAERPAISFRA
jgi:hypothetical protein